MKKLRGYKYCKLQIVFESHSNVWHFCFVASTQVVLTVQQKPMSNSGLTTSLSASARPVSLSSAAASALSPSGHITSLHRAATVPASTERITGPQPVDVSPSRTRAYLHAHKPSSNSAYFANSSARYYKLLHSTRSPLGISISRRSACVVEKKVRFFLHNQCLFNNVRSSSCFNFISCCQVRLTETRSVDFVDTTN